MVVIVIHAIGVHAAVLTAVPAETGCRRRLPTTIVHTQAHKRARAVKTKTTIGEDSWPNSWMPATDHLPRARVPRCRSSRYDLTGGLFGKTKIFPRIPKRKKRSETMAMTLKYNFCLWGFRNGEVLAQSRLYSAMFYGIKLQLSSHHGPRTVEFDNWLTTWVLLSIICFYFSAVIKIPHTTADGRVYDTADNYARTHTHANSIYRKLNQRYYNNTYYFFYAHSG